MFKENLIQNEVWAKGSKGGIELAKKVIELCDKKNSFKYAYDLNLPVEKKLNLIVKNVYGGKGVIFSNEAKNKLQEIKNMGLDGLPVIVAKTQYSLSSNEKLLGAPKNFYLEVKDFEIRNGAGFIVAVCGNILLMPGLPKKPAAEGMTIDANQKISGLF